MDAEKQPRLMDRVRNVLRPHHMALRTETAYCAWIKRFIRFSQMRHPQECGKADVEKFLTYLAVNRRVSAATQNQSLSALLFLYGKVLEINLPWLNDVVRARQSKRLPLVLSPEEVRAILSNMTGNTRLMVQLLYGTGMRQMELLRLRIKDIDFTQRIILVREGKGNKDRVVPLPQCCIPALLQQKELVTALFSQDRINNVAGVELPYALEKNTPMLESHWTGNGFSRWRQCHKIPVAKSRADITFTRKHWHAISAMPVRSRKSANPPIVIHFDTALRHIFCNKVPISEPYKSC